MNDNENKTNAPIIKLLPCPFCGSDDVQIRTRKTTIVECAECKALVIKAMKRVATAAWNKRAALNEADALRAEVEGYRAMLADEEFCEVNLWSYHPLCHDTPVSIAESAGKWRWYDALNEGKLVPNSPEFDTLLEAYAAIKPNAAAGGEGTDD